MNIAIFTNNYLPNPFGVSMSIESFRKEFEKLGHTVYVFAPEFEGYVDENPNVFRYPSLDFSFKGIHFPLAIPFSHKIGGILEKLEIDVIHSQHPNLLGWEARRWAKKKNVPLVFTWHTLYDKYAHFAPFVPARWASWWAIRNAVNYANKADQIIVPTKSIKKIIQNWGVSNSNIEAVATGVEESFFQGADRIGMRKQLGIADGETVLLSVSRLTKEKNVEFLVRAIIKILKKNEKIKFVLAGSGSELEKIKQLVFESGLSERVVFPGIMSRDLAKNLYAAGDVFVYASTSETQGMILTEAMCLGLPIVAVSATGSQDLVGNHVTGILVKENEDAFAEAALKLAKDENLRQHFGKNAKMIALENYTSEICARKMLAIYQKTIERKK
ncbi:MAG: glycosyltransferase [Candidatus Moranbacteria bacterium]|nr:glycosyltransferase [Candidatus Moranbacteria bacterium]